MTLDEPRRLAGFDDARCWRVSPVSRLFTPRRPTAIARLVIAVVVDAVNAVLQRGATAHVGKKIGVLAPMFADRNASSAIVLEILPLRVATSSADIGPCQPFWRLMGFAMQATSLASFFAMKASARSSATAPQAIAGQEQFSATIPATEPAYTSDVFKRSQTAKTLASKFNETRHVRRHYND
jgi:hypothetical protein